MWSARSTSPQDAGDRRHAARLAGGGVLDHRRHGASYGVGDPPSFALSVGGFHSQFRRPHPDSRRCGACASRSGRARIRGSTSKGFLALTSNTAQVGAAVDLYAAAGLAQHRRQRRVRGADSVRAGFAFEADLWAGVALRRGTRVLAGVHLDGSCVDRRRGISPARRVCRCGSSICASASMPRSARAQTVEPAADGDLAAPRAGADRRARRSWNSAMPRAAARAVTTPRRATMPPRAAAHRSGVGVVGAAEIVPLNRTIERFAHVAAVVPRSLPRVGAKLGTTKSRDSATYRGLVRAGAVRGALGRRTAVAAGLREDGRRVTLAATPRSPSGHS